MSCIHNVPTHNLKEINKTKSFHIHYTTHIEINKQTVTRESTSLNYKLHKKKGRKKIYI